MPDLNLLLKQMNVENAAMLSAKKALLNAQSQSLKEFKGILSKNIADAINSAVQEGGTHPSDILSDVHEFTSDIYDDTYQDLIDSVESDHAKAYIDNMFTEKVKDNIIKAAIKHMKPHLKKYVFKVEFNDELADFVREKVRRQVDLRDLRGNLDTHVKAIFNRTSHHDIFTNTEKAHILSKAVRHLNRVIRRTAHPVKTSNTRKAYLRKSFLGTTRRSTHRENTGTVEADKTFSVKSMLNALNNIN